MRAINNIEQLESFKKSVEDNFGYTITVNRVEHGKGDTFNSIFMSSKPNIEITDIFNLINTMEATADLIANEDQCDGYEAALDLVKRWFLGDMKFNEETGEYEKYLYGRKINEI